jgi:periplasmic protein CpxP/Spy
MPSSIYPIAMPVPFVRSLALAALISAAPLASPLTAAYADSAANAAFRLTQAAVPQKPSTAPRNPAAAGATETKGETVEQRITTLHSALKIMPDQDVKWKAVAQAMRENAAAMEKLEAETRKIPQRTMTAVDDLNMYQKFAQAHVDGLTNLIDDFKALYAAMPAAQKKTADEVFGSFGGLNR